MSYFSIEAMISKTMNMALQQLDIHQQMREKIVKEFWINSNSLKYEKIIKWTDYEMNELHSIM